MACGEHLRTIIIATSQQCGINLVCTLIGSDFNHKRPFSWIYRQLNWSHVSNKTMVRHLGNHGNRRTCLDEDCWVDNKRENHITWELCFSNDICKQPLSYLAQHDFCFDTLFWHLQHIITSRVHDEHLQVQSRLRSECDNILKMHNRCLHKHLSRDRSQEVELIVTRPY